MVYSNGPEIWLKSKTTIRRLSKKGDLMVDSIFLSKFFDGKIVDVVSDVGLDRISYKCDNDTIYSFVKKNRLLELMKDKVFENGYSIQTVKHFNSKRWEAKLFSSDDMERYEFNREPVLEVEGAMSEFYAVANIVDMMIRKGML